MEVKKDIEELIKEIEEIRQSITIPLRLGEKIPEKQMTSFLNIIDELVDVVREKEVIPKRLISLLWFIYGQFEAPVHHKKVRYPHPDFMNLVAYSSRMQEMFDYFKLYNNEEE